MRKSIFLGLATFAMLLTTSCVNEIAPSKEIGDTPVTFQIGTPEIATRAYSDGKTATKLQYAVYDKDDNLLDALTVEDAEINGSTSIELQLVTGNEYSIIFWAAAEGAPYDVNFATKTMTVDYTGAVSNAENRDAFYKYHTFTVKGAQTETIELKRPFAQLNIGTNDYDKSASAGYEPAYSYVKVPVSSTLNLVDGTVDTAADVEFKLAAIPTTEEFPVQGYKYISMNYLLVSADKEVVDVTFGYSENNQTVEKTRTVGSVPVQRNHRTNIYGQLFTSDVDINVEIKPEYENDDKYGAIDGQVYVKVSNALEFNEAFVDENVDIIILTEDIVLDESLTRAGGDPELVVSKGKAVTIDLAGNKLSSTSTGTGKNYNMFDVRGTMTVKNGTMEYEHKGDNMGWSNSTNLFNVTDGGVLNIEGVTAKNLGGSDMAFVAHLNNWGEVTLNVKNSVLESPYIAVRVFNSGNDMNNVTIKGSTLKGTRSFWVHNYTVADFGTQEKADAHKALLNFDIFNDQANPSSDDNTFIYDEENKLGPVCYGFTNDIYFDQYGNEISQYIPILDAEGNEVAGVAYDPASATEVEGETVYTTIVVTAAAGMNWFANEVDNGNSFEGKTIKLDTDIDLYKVDENGNPVCFEPIGSYRKDKAFKGIFDGQNHTISNMSQNTWALDNGYYYSDLGMGLFGKVQDATIKNLKMDNASISGESGLCGIVAGAAYGDVTFENITVTNSKCNDYQYYAGGIVGWASGNHTYKNCNIDASNVVGGQWGDFGNSNGGVIGGISESAQILMEDCNVACIIDAVNDVVSAYQYYAYRCCGMLIGNTNQSQVIDETTYAAAPQLTCKNVTVTYGDWMNYTYCEFAGTDYPYVRVQAGVSVDAYTNIRYGHPTDANGNIVVDDNHVHNAGEDHHICLPFDQLLGGGPNGDGRNPVYGLASFPGVTVNYPTNN